MQIVPSQYTENEMYNTSSSTTDYSQDPSQATFSQDLNDALSSNGDGYDDSYGDAYDNDTYDEVFNSGSDQSKEWKKSLDSDYASIDEALSDTPYSGQAENFSLFVPQPVRFTSAELDKLSKSLMADGVSADAINAVKAMAGKVGGPSIEELLGAVKQSMTGGNVSLSDKEVGLLQTLSGRLSPENPDKLYNAIRYGSGTKGIDELSAALANKSLKLSTEEVATIGKAMNLSEDAIAGLTQKMGNLEGKELNSKDIEGLFGDASAEIKGKADAYDKMQASLSKHLKPIVNEAEKREELSRESQMRESKSVAQSRILIEDTVVTRVLGDDLNRTNVQDPKQSDKSKKSRSEGDSVDGNNRFTNENGKKVANAAGSQQNVESELNKKVVTKDTKDAFSHGAANASDSKAQGTPVKGSDASGIAQMLAEKNTAQNSTLTNPLLSQGSDQVKANDKLFNDNLVNSQFLEKKEQDTGARGLQENSGKNGDKKNSRDDDRGGRNLESAKYEYAFASASQSHSSITPSSSSSSSAASFAELGGNLFRHSNDVRTQVQDSMKSMVKDGTQRIEISLNPVELGQLNIALSIKNGEISATIQTEKPESASMINMQMDSIRADLENQGFKIEKIEVEVGLSQDSRQEWQGMEQHNSSRENSENAQYLEHLRSINKLGMTDGATLAHNMQSMGNTASQTANSAMTGLHIIA